MSTELIKKLTRWERLDSIELHTFGDASIKGVSSAVYAVVQQKTGWLRALCLQSPN